MKTITALCLGLALAATAHAAPPADAARFTDVLREAVKQYQAGELDKARTALDEAAAMIDARQTDAVADSFPDPPKGWKAGEIERENILDLLGGGKTVRKTYSGGAGRGDVTLEVITGSKLAPLVAGIGSNDVIAQSQGYTVKRIGSDRALLKGAELILPVDDRVVIKLTAKGGAGEKELMALAREVDRNALRRMK